MYVVCQRCSTQALRILEPPCVRHAKRTESAVEGKPIMNRWVAFFAHYTNSAQILDESSLPALKADTTSEPLSSLSSGVGEKLQRLHAGAFRRRALALAVSAAAALSGVVLRWFGLGRQSLYVDEIHTEFVSRLSPSNLVHYLIRTSAHPPLYFLLEHYWRGLFGNSEYALRALSALFGTISLPVFYLFAKKILRDSIAAALAMWLFAFSLTQLWYSQEARTYELTSFFALVGLYALILLLEKTSVILFAIIVLSVAASLYMHNMMLFYGLALNVLWLTYPCERAWTERLKEVFLADALIGILYLPWVPHLFAQAARSPEYFSWSHRPTIWTFFRTLTVIAGFFLDYLVAVAARVLPLSLQVLRIFVNVGAVLLSATLVISG